MLCGIDCIMQNILSFSLNVYGTDIILQITPHI